MKEKYGATVDTELYAEAMAEICEQFQRTYQETDRADLSPRIPGRNW